MAYCKRCVCGYLNKYEKAGGSPLVCQRDKRPLRNRTEMLYTGQPDFIPPHQKEQTPQETAELQPSNPDSMTANPPSAEKTLRKKAVFSLVSSDGQEFILPDGTSIVGRFGIASEYLLHFRDVSREHFQITPRSSAVCALLNDISSFGTSINGTQIAKNTPIPITNGCMIRLAKSAMLTLKIEIKEVEEDA